MSTTISISLFHEDSHIAKGFVALLERILARGQLACATLRERSVLHATELELDQFLTRVCQLVTELVPSDRALTVECSYELASARYIGLDLQLYGARYEMGFAARENGPIRVIMSANDLFRPLKDAVDEGEKIDTDTLAALGSTISKDADALFLDLCGLSTASDGVVEHGAMYLEKGWPSGAGCSMLYHRDVREFSRDFMRIYAEYNWGMFIPVTLRNGVNVWELRNSEGTVRSEPGKARPRFYRQFAGSNEDQMWHFLNGLSEAEATRLSQIPADLMRSLLGGIGVAVPASDYLDFGMRGGALTNGPLIGLWEAYAHIASIA